MKKKKNTRKYSQYTCLWWGLISTLIVITTLVIQQQYYTKIVIPRIESSSSEGYQNDSEHSEYSEPLTDIFEVNSNAMDTLGIYLMGAPIDVDPIKDFVDSNLFEKINKDVESIEEYNRLIEGEGEFSGITADDISIGKTETYARQISANSVLVVNKLEVLFKGDGPNNGVKQIMLMDITYSKIDNNWIVSELPMLSLLTDVPTFASSSS